MPKKSKSWFEVSKEGLAELQNRRGAEHLLFELWSNAIDEPIQGVVINLESLGQGEARITVEDDSPNGFRNLADAFTLFTPTPKWKDPTKRGRFNLGEKLVIATCKVAEIETTKGTVVFCAEGRFQRNKKRDKGSRFAGLLKVKKGDVERMTKAVYELIPPANIVTVFNGMVLPSRKPLACIEVTLPTEVADSEGHLKPTERKTIIEVHEPLAGEKAKIYEMGIPVVETGDKWHYNILQKVPLSSDRNNVRASYLREVRIAVFNELYAKTTAEDANSDWVQTSVNDIDCQVFAFEHWQKLKFGDKSVAFDPSDLEANKRAVAEGYTVVTGRMMGAGAWQNAKAFDNLPAAGKVTPSHKVWSGEGVPDADVFKDWIPCSKWTDGMRQIADYIKTLAPLLINRNIEIKYCSSVHHLTPASYGNGEMVFNKLRLGNDWFEQGITQAVDALMIHELAHEAVSDHLSEDYYRELCRIGAKLKALAIEKPQLFHLRQLIPPS